MSQSDEPHFLNEIKYVLSHPQCARYWDSFGLAEVIRFLYHEVLILDLSLYWKIPLNLIYFFDF